MARPGLAVTEPLTDVRGLKTYEAHHIVCHSLARPGLAVTEPLTDVRGLKTYEARHIVCHSLARPGLAVTEPPTDVGGLLWGACAYRWRMRVMCGMLGATLHAVPHR